MTTLLLFLALTIILAASCDIFNSDDKTTDAHGWKRTSLPSKLKGDWKLNGVHYMSVSSTKTKIDNREWGIITVDQKDDEYRLNLRSSYQYMVAYFRNLTDTTVEKAE